MKDVYRICVLTPAAVCAQRSVAVGGGSYERAERLLAPIPPSREGAPAEQALPAQHMVGSDRFHAVHSGSCAAASMRGRSARAPDVELAANITNRTAAAMLAQPRRQKEQRRAAARPTGCDALYAPSSSGYAHFCRRAHAVLRVCGRVTRLDERVFRRGQGGSQACQARQGRGQDSRRRPANTCTHNTPHAHTAHRFETRPS